MLLVLQVAQNFMVSYISVHLIIWRGLVPDCFAIGLVTVVVESLYIH
jgi:hypothetical protein